jgi:hypothetical protein
MTNCPIKSPVLTHDNMDRKSPVHTYMVRMEVKSIMSAVGRLETVCASNYDILFLIPYENIK